MRLLERAERLGATLVDALLSETDGRSGPSDDRSPSRPDAALRESRLLTSGVIRRIADVTIDCGGGVMLHGASALYGGGYRARRYVLPRVCGGSGFSRERARARAAGEAAERFCGAVYDERGLVLDRARNLAPDAIAPEDFALFSERQYREPGFAFRPFRDDTPVNWAWGYSFRRRAPVLVPAAFVYRPYWPVGEETPIAELPGTGLACGDTPAEAALRGLYEVVERDAIMITWLNRLPAPRVDPAGWAFGPVTGERLDALAGLGASLSVHDITTDAGIPARFALLIDRGRGGLVVSAGAAARWAHDAAVEKAVAEALYLRVAVEGSLARVPAPAPDPEYRDVETLEDHMRLFSAPSLLPALDFLVNAPVVRRDGPAAASTAPGGPGDLRRGWWALAERGLDVIAVDVTLPEAADAGLSVVRVIVPGMIPLTFGRRYAAKGGARLYRVPVALGYRAREVREEDLNPVPHPFA